VNLSEYATLGNLAGMATNRSVYLEGVFARRALHDASTCVARHRKGGSRDDCRRARAANRTAHQIAL